MKCKKVYGVVYSEEFLPGSNKKVFTEKIFKTKKEALAFKKQIEKEKEVLKLSEKEVCHD